MDVIISEFHANLFSVKLSVIAQSYRNKLITKT